MANKKKPLASFSIPDLYKAIVDEYPFDMRVGLLNMLKEGVKAEALIIKEKGEKAALVLDNLTNGE